MNKIEGKMVDKLREKHGKYYVDKTIKQFTKSWLSTSDIFKPYLNMPDLHIITNMFDSQRYEIITERITNSEK